MTRRIAVVTSSRADYGHLYWPLVELRAHAAVNVQLMVTGAHLSREFGSTIDVIEEDGFEVAARVACMEEGNDDSRSAMGRAIGRATIAFTDELVRLQPDLLVLIADRYEMLGPASAAVALRLPIAHIEGGEASEGALDHVVRNALTMMSHVHLVPTELARRRVIAMGEESWRVHRTGAPSLDHLRRSTLLDRQAVEALLELDLATSPIIVAYHPVTLDDDPGGGIGEVLAGLGSCDDRPIIFCYPNADAGGRAIRRAIEAFTAEHARAKLVVNLDPIAYWSLLRCAGAMYGNSSSGIMESPALGIPAVNIGSRQDGRERADNVIDAPPQRAVLATALGRALSRGRSDVANPYGDGHAAERIARALADVEINDRLLRKPALEIT